jgi:hypothetical protein
MKFRIQVTKTITLREELEVECEHENILDRALDDIEESRLEGTDELADGLNMVSGIKVTEYQEDGSGEVEIEIENVYSVDGESEED